MPRRKTLAARPRGNIEELPSGALRVRVYAGVDPLTKRPHYLRETIPAGPKADRRAQETLARFINEVAERRNPRTDATVNQLLTRYLSRLDDVEPKTIKSYRGYYNNHIYPAIGRLKIAELDGDVFDSFRAELRRCRIHCRSGKRKPIDHRTDLPHQCDEHTGKPCSPPDPDCTACRRRCKTHQCRPLGDSTIRKVNFLISGALTAAVRWKWISVNPFAEAELPAEPIPDPQPPTPEEAARILNAAWKDVDWGTLLWTAMTTGARRGEFCALRWKHLDIKLTCLDCGRDQALSQKRCLDCDSTRLEARGTVTIRRAIGQDGARVWETDTKTHQQRRVALDPETLIVLIEHRQRREARTGEPVDPESYVFSRDPAGTTHLLPDSCTQRYAKLVARLGIHSTLHKLRHYSATELISAGVDVRTVAGRLGHAGGGTTTLRVYAAWKSEADQRAATSLTPRMPTRPIALSPAEQSMQNPQSPYEKIAANLRAKILNGTIPNGQPFPPVDEIAREYGRSVGTAHRAVALLQSWGLIEVSRGKRAIVRAR